jgi:hypothetical protein
LSQETFKILDKGLFSVFENEENGSVVNDGLSGVFS